MTSKDIVVLHRVKVFLTFDFNSKAILPIRWCEFHERVFTGKLQEEINLTFASLRESDGK
jgi:hypothetical protein